MANFVHMRVKHALACRRPIEYSAQVQPMILTPAHGALPSGHATETFAAAFVLWKLLGKTGDDEKRWGKQLMRLAARVAINRTVAGVHFPVDSAAGAILGITLGRYLLARCSGASDYVAWSFDGATYPADQDFFWDELLQISNGTLKSIAYSKQISSTSQSIDPAMQSKILTWLWNKAKAEWS